MFKHKILFAEDEPTLAKIVTESLESRGFEVLHCKDGEVAKQAYPTFAAHLLILDVMMPKIDGFSLAKEIRNQDPFIPIIFLTAKSQTQDVVDGFKHGGNDYLKKPFSMEELIVRMHALIERNQLASAQTAPKPNEPITIGQYRFDFQKQSLSIGEQSTALTYREAEVLKALSQSPNELIEKGEMLNQIWKSNDFYTSRNLDVYITKLRKKLRADPAIEIINVRGYGYKLIC